MGYNFEEFELWEGDVVVFDHDWSCVVKWCGAVKSIIVYNSLDDFITISVNHNRVLKHYNHRCNGSHTFVDYANAGGLI